MDLLELSCDWHENLCIMSLKTLAYGFGLLILFLSRSSYGNDPVPPNFLHCGAEYGRIDDSRDCFFARDQTPRARGQVPYYKDDLGSEHLWPKVYLSRPTQ